MSDSDDTEREFASMKAISAALEALPTDARDRVLRWVASKYGGHSPSAKEGTHPVGRDEKAPSPDTVTHDTLAELFDAARPDTERDKALVAAYWESGEDSSSFDAQSLNTQLKHLGHGIGNITRALGSLIEDKPALVIQLRKSGTSRQARKLFKITEAGKKRVLGLINKNASGESA